MRRDQPPKNWTPPNLWLVSDMRNDAGLEAALANLPGRSGFVYRHYHLDEADRRARYEALRALCRKHGHLVIYAGDPELAADWAADGVYGPPENLGGTADLLRFATVHDANEVARANRAGVDAMFLSPVFQTRSHPGRECLGIAQFHALAALATSPVIALGGMNAQRALDLGWPRWGAIDGHLR